MFTVEALNTKLATALGSSLDLLALDFGKSGDRVETTVLGQGHGNGVESLRKGTHGVLFKARGLDSRILDGQRAGNLGSTTTVDNAVITDQVSHHAKSIMQRSLGLVDNLGTLAYFSSKAVNTTHHLVATSDKDCNSPGVGALLNDKHLLPCCTEGHLSDNTSRTQLRRGKVLESGNYSAVGSNSNQLNLRPTDPSNSWQLVLEEEMVGLVVETPLADGQVSTCILDLLNHLDKLLLFVVLKLLELLDAGDIKVLGNSDIASLVVTVGNSDRVDSLVDQVGSLLQESTSKNNDTSGTVTNLIVLGLGELN
ncbi:hypothetical protein HG531_010090 [Fusarium graminearum]|nr:hypothetical protein HG531_010090 [Fusarium graminearum]